MQYPVEFDRKLSEAVAKLPESARAPLAVVTNMAAPGVLAFIFLVWFLLFRNHAAVSGALLVFAFTPLAEILKLFTRRTRPKTLYVENMKIKTYSFPSGHAYVSALIFSFAAYLCFQYLAAPLGIILATIFVVLIVLVGLSRVYLGAHFPSDVLAGWALGVFVTTLILTKGPALL